MAEMMLNVLINKLGCYEKWQSLHMGLVPTFKSVWICQQQRRDVGFCFMLWRLDQSSSSTEVR